MRTAAAIVLITITAMGYAREARAEHDEPIVTLRVHDYVNVDRQALAEAQRLVAHFYANAGVTAKWKTTILQGAYGGAEPIEDGLEDLTIIVLDRRMATDRRLPLNALGSAVVGRGEPGRIAYVLYERIAHAARASEWPTGDMLAVVMAHELGHLLLPPGSHTAFGLMRAHWTVADLRRTKRLSLAFSRRQGERMRELLNGDGRRSQATPALAAVE